MNSSWFIGGFSMYGRQLIVAAGGVQETTQFVGSVTVVADGNWNLLLPTPRT
jgi:hypothetical protein